MKSTKRNLKKIVASLLVLVLSFSCMSTAYATTTTTTEIALKDRVSNANGNSTDVGIWYTAYNCDSFWNARFAGADTAPVGYDSLLPDGTYGVPESSNPEIIDFHLEKMAEAGIDFILLDLTNGGLTSEVPYGWSDAHAYAGNRWTVEYAKLTAERVSAWNDSHKWKIRYAIAVGTYAAIVDDSTIGAVSEAQAEAVYNIFVQNEVYGDDYYCYDGDGDGVAEPLYILHDWGKNSLECTGGLYDYQETNDTPYCDMFTVRRGQAGQAGSFGWHIGVNNGVTVHDEEVELVSPGQQVAGSINVSRYNSATGNLTYDDCFNTVLSDTTMPRILMIASFNDYMENTVVFVTDTSEGVLENGEEKWYVNGVDGEIDNYLYWNKTINYLAQIRAKNADAGYTNVEPTVAYENYALGKAVTASSQLGSYAASNATDGIYSSTASGTTSSAITSYSSGLGYFNVDLGSATTINNVKVKLYTQVANERPRDLAIDVLLEDGTWKRVAETHADATKNIYDIYTSGTNYISNINTLDFNFEPVKCTAFRVTANAIGTKNMYGSSANFRVNEIEAYNDPTVTKYDYTGVEAPVVEGTEIPRYKSANLALNATVTSGTSVAAGSLANVVNGSTSGLIAVNYDSATKCAYYNIEFSESKVINDITVKFYNAEAFKRARDYAVDVLTEDGWVRVSELHYDGVTDIFNASTTSNNTSTVNSLSFKFAETEATAFRVTANYYGSRVLLGSSQIWNFMVSEIEAYNDPNISEDDYTGFEPVAVEGTEIAGITRSENLALNGTVTASVDTPDQGSLADVVNGAADGQIAIGYTSNSAYYNIEFAQTQLINDVNVVFYNNEAYKRPRDIAVDVLTDDAWVRVAEIHYDGVTDIFNAPDSTYNTSDVNSIDFKFAAIKANAVRVTANSVGTTTIQTDTDVNFSVAEIEAYYDSGITPNDYMGVAAATVTGTEIPIMTLINYALSGTASTDSPRAFASTNPITRIIDGSTASGNRAITWYGNSANDSDVRYFQITMDKARTINKVVAYLDGIEALYCQDYAVDVLLTSGEWKRVAEVHDLGITAMGRVLTFNFEAVEASAVRFSNNRLTHTKYATTTNKYDLVLSLRELEIYNDPNVTEYTGVTKSETIVIPEQRSDNLALGQKVTSSNTVYSYWGEYPPANLTDGNISTSETTACAISNFNSDSLASFTISFTEIETLNNVKLYLSAHESTTRPYEYIIEVKTKDGWVRVATALASDVNSNHQLNIEFAAVECDAFRVIANNENGSAPNFRMVEVRAYYDPAITIS